jgi:hypothetical protein
MLTAYSLVGQSPRIPFNFHPIDRGLELLVFPVHVSCRPHSGEAQLRRLDKLGTLVSNMFGLIGEQGSAPVLLHQEA